jgi:hypothetical protein
MSKSLDKALETHAYRDKVGFSSGTVKSLAKAMETKPFFTLATGVTAGGLLGGALGVGANSTAGLTGEPVATTSYELNKLLRPGIGGVLTRIKADEEIAKNLTQNAGNLTNEFINATVANMGKSYTKLINKPNQEALLKDLLDTDDMLREADPEHVADLFNTMRDIAPRMTKYKDAVKSFLRQGIAHEGGLDPTTLGELAKAEANLSGKAFTRGR